MLCDTWNIRTKMLLTKFCPTSNFKYILLYAYNYNEIWAITSWYKQKTKVCLTLGKYFCHITSEIKLSNQSNYLQIHKTTKSVL